MRSAIEVGFEDAFQPPTASTVATIEKELAIRFPTTYVEFLTVANGGSPALWRIDYINADNVPVYQTVNWIYSLVDDMDEQCGVIWNTVSLRQAMRGRRPVGQLVAIGENPGGDQFYLDLSLAMSPVFIWWHDEQTVGTIANSFAEFVDALNDRDEFD